MNRCYQVVNRHFKLLWIQYAIFINQRTQPEQNKQRSALNWQNKFFTQIIRYGLPAAVISFIPSAIIQYQSGSYLAIYADLMIFTVVIWVALHQKITIHYKKIFGLAFIVIFAIIKVIVLQSLMFGSVFLLLSSIFTTLLFNKRAAYFSVALNAFICTYFVIFQFQNAQQHSLDLVHSHLSNRWLFYSFNFIFVNFILVSIILYIVYSFEKNIDKSTALYQKVSLEVKERMIRGKLLQESLTHYKALFIFNPLPMMIYDPISLELLYVNKAATLSYGYSRKEFINVAVNTLSRTERQAFIEKIQYEHAHIRDRHYKKNGDILLVDIYASNIKLRGAWRRLAIIRDITTENSYLDAIEKKNEKMREIAYLQSHVIRNPLSRILGITQLISSSHVTSNELDPYLLHLINSAKELDQVVTNIVRQTENELREN